MKNLKRKNILSSIMSVLVIGIFVGSSFFAYQMFRDVMNRRKVLQDMIVRLEADSRISEVLVTNVEFNPITQEHMTTIKFLEYDAMGRPMAPKYFTFSGNIIQFQSLVVRFADVHVRMADALRGKSVYLFWKVFMLNGEKTQEYPITNVNEIPAGYKVGETASKFEKEIWQEFWKVALDSKWAKGKGIKNAQIEAPGTKFIPGILYTLVIEHDGGIRIDSEEIPEVLKGEKL